MMGFIMGVSGFIAGGWGIAVIALAVSACYILAAAQLMPPRTGHLALACGCGAWLGAFLVRSFMTAA